MDEKRFVIYNEKRNSILKDYRAKKLKSVFTVLGIAALVLLAVVLLALLINNVAVGLVVGMMIVIFTIIMVRIKIVTVNLSLQEKLRHFEEEYE